MANKHADITTDVASEIAKPPVYDVYKQSKCPLPSRAA